MLIFLDMKEFNFILGRDPSSNWEHSISASNLTKNRIDATQRAPTRADAMLLKEQ